MEPTKDIKNFPIDLHCKTPTFGNVMYTYYVLDIMYKFLLETTRNKIVIAKKRVTNYYEMHSRGRSPQ